MSHEAESSLWERDPDDVRSRLGSETVNEVLRSLDRAAAEVPERAPARDYRIEAEIGRGGMGVVLRAWDQRLRRAVAMKVAQKGDGPRLARFLREARITGQLQHPGIVPVHELGVNERGEHFFTMPIVHGERLDELFRKAAEETGGWSQARVLGVLVRVCETLTFAHERGVVHRDVKPENIMVGRFGETFVLDWGLAKVLARDESANALEADALEDDAAPPDLGSTACLHTRLGGVVGSPNYVAPEQAAGQEVGRQADVYSVGAMLYALLAGRPPYAESPSSTNFPFSAVCGGPPTPLTELVPRAPAELLAITARAMARAPRDRYASMAELADDLRAFTEGRVVRAHRVGAFVELEKWIGRNRSVAAWMAATLGVGLVGLGALAWFQNQRRRAEFLAADVTRLPYLLREAEELWPAEPEHVAEFDRWLVAAAELAEREALHRERARVSVIAGHTLDVDERYARRARRELVEGFAALQETIADVRDRRAFAQAIRWRSLEDPEVAARWREACASIADARECPSYGGLVIEPQLGLVPLGRDPHSGLWEFVHLATGSAPRRNAAGELELEAATGVVFVLVPPGDFLMGAQACEDREVHYDPKSYSWESPPHEVHLGAFFLSKYEMTQAQWQRVARANPSTYTEMGERTPEREGLLPVETVSWTEATRVLTRLGLELPTEAQWEYAARAGTDTRTWCGDSELTLRDAWAANVFDLRAWYEYEDQRTIDPSHVDWLDDGFALHAPVGSFAANAFGFHDVLGNVWEWCEDLLTPYVEEPRRGDGLRSVPAPGRERVLRGGCFRNTGSNLSSSNRENLTEDVRLPYLGVRPARAVR